MPFLYPASEALNVKLTSAKNFSSRNIEIMDMTGKKIESIKLENENFKIDLSKYSNGIYILKLFGEGTVVSMHKFIVQKK